MNQSAKKVLFVASPSPYTQSYGSQLRVKTLLDSLEKCSRVSLVLASVKNYAPAVLQETAAKHDLQAVFRLHSSPPRGLDRLRAELNPRYLNTHGFAASPEDRRKFLSLAREHDLVWFHTVRLPNALGLGRLDTPTVMDADDLLSRYHESASQQGGLLSRLRARKNFWQWRRREALFLERFSALTVCSEGDKAYLGGSDRIHVIPNGFAKSTSPAGSSRQGAPTIGFVGLLTYEPNRDGLWWFLKEVWPSIRQSLPDARLRIVGKGSEAFSGAGVEAIGWVEDLAAESAGWWLTIVPLHVGGGTRVKIATAFSQQIPVVSTSLGAYGYAVTHGQEIMLADTPAAFAQACLQVLGDATFAGQLAERARRLFEQNWSEEAIAPKVARVVELAIVPVLKT